MARRRSYICLTDHIHAQTLSQHQIKNERQLMALTWPEQYSLPRSTYVPNNVLLALIYWKVLPIPLNPELAKHLFQRNDWEERLSARVQESFACKLRSTLIREGRERQEYLISPLILMNVTVKTPTTMDLDFG